MTENSLDHLKPTIRIFMYKSKRKVQPGIKYYPTVTERDDILTNLSDSAYILYSFYLTRDRGVSYSDKAMKRVLPSWSLSKIKRHRLALTKAGYFKTKTFPKNSAGEQIVLTTVGKQYKADKL